MVLPGGAIFGVAHPPSPTSSSAGASIAAMRAPSGLGGAHPAGPLAGFGLPSAPTQTSGVPTGFSSPSTVPSSSIPLVKSLEKAASARNAPYSGTLSALAENIASGKVLPSSVYIPNLNAISGPHSPGQGVGVGYTVAPAPMGIGDFGLGGPAGTPFVYNTSHFAGSTTLSAANATYPAAYYYVGGPGGYNSPYNFGMQLNTVTSNISIPGNSAAALWTQNVVTLNGNNIGLEDNVWNFSSPSLTLNPGTIYSNAATGVFVDHELYYDYGPVFTLTFPVTVNLYNNASIVNDRDQVTFGYRIVDSAGTFQGIYDTVVFNNPNYPTAPTNTPVFEVNGQTSTPSGLSWDSEFIMGGPGGGSNAVFDNISGTMNLQYSNLTSGGWKSVPSAYDFGTDTGETAIGVAETWSPGGTVTLSTGPSFLYGLWNSQTSTAVPSGSVEYQGTLNPSYGFIFMDPNVPFYTNESYVPTNAQGGYLTYLPPGTYDMYFLADGFDAKGVFGLSGSHTGGTTTLTADPTAPFSSPLYLNGNAQAQAAAVAISGWTTGPYVFANRMLLTGIEALFFNHMNDAGYETFNMFQATGVTDAINATDLFQGYTNASGPNTNPYYMDGAPRGTPWTLLSNPTELTSSLPQYGSIVAFYSDPSVRVYEQEMDGWFAGSSLDGNLYPYYNANPAGGAVVLWNSPNANISTVLGLDGTLGAWVADSPGLSFYNGAAAYGANAVSVVSSSGAVVNLVEGEFSESWSNNVGTVNQIPFGVYDDASAGGMYTHIYGFAGGVGFADFGGVGAIVNNVSAEYNSEDFGGNISGEFGFSEAVLLNAATDTSINNTYAYVDSFGVVDGLYGFGSFATTVTNTTADGGLGQAYAVVLFGSDYTNVTNLLIEGAVEGGFLYGAQNTTFDHTTIYFDETGLAGALLGNTTFKNTNVSEVDTGIALEGVYATTFTNFNASAPMFVDASVGAYLDVATDTVLTNVVGYGSMGVVVNYATGVTATTIVGTDFIPLERFALYIDNGSGATVTGVTASEESGGVDFQYFSSATVTTVSASDFSTGVEAYYSTGITVSNVTGSMFGEGVYADESTQVTVTTVTLGDSSLGVGLDYSDYVTVSDITAADASLGVFADESDWTTVNTVTLTNNSVGVYSEYSYYTYVSGVTATNPTLTAPDTGANPYVDEIAAVYTYEDWADSISNVQVTSYPAALYDYYSHVPGVANVNATSSYFGIYLEDTYGGVFQGIGAYMDVVGMYLDLTAYNTVTQSSFVDCSSYGVYAYDGTYDYIYDNSFIGNNGATGTYNAAHIQAYSGYGNDYYYFEGVGNYWSDWHTYNQYGNLAPYPLQDNNWDYYPLGGPEGTVGVFFYESGLASGTMWSMTFNGVMQSTSHDWLVFYVLPGTYAFTTGSVANYSDMPASGMVTASSGYIDNDVTYTALYNVTVTETGLPTTNTPTWSATVGGVTDTGTTQALGFSMGAGTYSYQISPVAGYTVSPSSGTLTVVNGNYNLVVTFTQVTYAVTVTESGLSSGQSWSATVGTDTQTSTGTAITFSLANGSYTVKVLNVSGYSLSNGGSVSVTVNGAPAGASVTFSPSTTTSLVSSDTFNMWLAVAIAIAVIALVIALLAVFMRQRREDQQQQPAQAWTPPPAGSTETAAGEAPAAGSSGNWSEGPPAGGSPPS
jgi:hypothetical protein